MQTTVRQCRLRDLLRGICDVPSGQDREIYGISLDSRCVARGDLFLALPGTIADGRDYIVDALGRGAAAVVYEAGRNNVARSPAPVFAVDRLRNYASVIADRFYGSPSRDLTVIGVTGTNGKTTCTQLLGQALDRSPARCAVIGTLGYGFPGALNTSLHTTPDPVTVQRLMREFLNGGARYLSMEVSSHALEQGRVNAVAFSVAAFTNLTREHLDYHGDMDTYAASKAALFDLPSLRCAVINQDDAFGRALLAKMGGRVQTLSYGLEGGQVRATRVEFSPDGLILQAATPVGNAEVRSPLFGQFNAANLLAALATLLALDITLEDAAARLSRAQPVAGRVERYGGGGNTPLVIVDYAHTPDALEKVLLALRQHAAGRLWCIFGCGGNRDPGKRPEMGRIAEELADIVVLADDNPRHESPEQIVAEIEAGMQTPARIIHDRRQAISTAITEASRDDVILVAGKGHEDYQQFGDVRRPYSDRETVRELLQAQGGQR